MMMITVERKNHTSYIHLNRPESYNALNIQMLRELYDAVREVAANDDEVVILHGNGNAFSAGGDMQMLKEFADKGIFDDVMNTIKDIIYTLYKMPKILIAAVNGAAAGLGLSLVLVADYVVAHKKAKLGVLFLGVGLVPDGGGHFLLQERLGTHAAKQFTWSGKQVKGEEAARMGLVDELTEVDALEAASTLAQKLQQSPIQAMIGSKMIYHEESGDRLHHFLDAETNKQWQMRQTEDHHEGVDAFIEKRTPQFKGK